MMIMLATAFAVASMHCGPRSLCRGEQGRGHGSCVQSAAFSFLKMEPSVESDCRATGGKGHRDAEAWRREGAAASHCW